MVDVEQLTLTLLRLQERSALMFRKSLSAGAVIFSIENSMIIKRSA